MSFNFMNHLHKEFKIRVRAFKPTALAVNGICMSDLPFQSDTPCISLDSNVALSTIIIELFKPSDISSDNCNKIMMMRP